MTYISKKAGRWSFRIFGKQVCKIALLKTLKVSELSGGRNALSSVIRDKIISHISSFPKYFSHYTRNQTNLKYLNADLNLAKMYRLYKEKAQRHASQQFYKKNHQNFNLRFKKQKKKHL